MDQKKPVSFWKWAGSAIPPVVGGVLWWAVTVRFPQIPEWVGGLALWLGIVLGLVYLAYLLQERWPSLRQGRSTWACCGLACLLGIMFWPLVVVDAGPDGTDQSLNRSLFIGETKLEAVIVDGKKAAQVTVAVSNKTDRPLSFKMEVYSAAVGQRTANATMKNAREETLSPNATLPYLFPLFEVDPIIGKEVRVIISVVVKYRFAGGNTYRILRQTKNCILRLSGEAVVPTCPYDLNEDDQIAQ